jgi:hypothetical protein
VVLWDFCVSQLVLGKIQLFSTVGLSCFAKYGRPVEERRVLDLSHIVQGTVMTIQRWNQLLEAADLYCHFFLIWQLVVGMQS